MTKDIGRSGSGEPSGHQPTASAPSGASQSGVPNAVREDTFAIEISFGGVGVNVSREAHSRIVDAVSLICAEYEERHPDCVMWAAEFGAKMLRHPMALSDDEPIPFDDSVEVIGCCCRERFDDERIRPYRDPVAKRRAALVAHNDALRSAYQVVARSGANTNWGPFGRHLLRILSEHHRTVNEARDEARAASGIEAAAADETALAGSAEGESPVAESETPNANPDPHPQGEVNQSRRGI